MSHIFSALRFFWKQIMRPNPLLGKQSHTLTLTGCFTVRMTFFLPGKFQTRLFMRFRYTVISSEKIARSQFVCRRRFAHFKRFFRWSSVSSGFDIGRLYFPPASCNCRQMVVWLNLGSCFLQAVLDITAGRKHSSSASERMFLSSFGVVARRRPERGKSVRSLGPFHRSSYISRSIYHTWPLSRQPSIQASDPKDGRKGKRFRNAYGLVKTLHKKNSQLISKAKMNEVNTSCDQHWSHLDWSTPGLINTRTGQHLISPAYL